MKHTQKNKRRCSHTNTHVNKQLKPKWLCIFSHAWHFGWCPQFRPSTHSLGSPPSHPHTYPTLTAYMAALLIGRLAALCSADAVMMCCYSVAALLLFCCCYCSACVLLMTRMTTTATTTYVCFNPMYTTSAPLSRYSSPARYTNG